MIELTSVIFHITKWFVETKISVEQVQRVGSAFLHFSGTDRSLQLEREELHPALHIEISN